MNRASAYLLIVFTSFAAAAVAPAQTAPVLATSTNHLIEFTGSSCPVGLRAQPDVSIGPAMLIIVTGKGTASQQLNLQLSNPDGSRNITHAQITVHGLTEHGRISPAAFGNPDPSTIAKQVDLALTVAPGANESTDLRFKGFTSVRWIDLDSLTYADGSTWQASPQHTCQIVPNRVMLVASH